MNYADLSRWHADLVLQDEQAIRERSQFLDDWATQIIARRYRRFLLRKKMTRSQFWSYVDSLARDMKSEDLIRKDLIEKVLMNRSRSQQFGILAITHGHQASGILYDN